MDIVIRNTSIAGAVIFGVMSFLTMGVFACFVGKGLMIQYRKSTREYHFNWLNSIWIYLALGASFLVLTLLYSLNAVEYGFFLKPTLKAVSWLRWLALTVCSVIHVGLLAFVMTREERDDDTFIKVKEVGNNNNNERKGAVKLQELYEQHFIPAQSLFIVFFHGFAYLCFYFSTISILQKQHIVWMVASVISFILSILLFFFPYNKFMHTNSHKRDFIYFTSYENDVNHHQHVESTNATPTGIETDTGIQFYGHNGQNKIFSHTIKPGVRKMIIMTYRVIFLLFSVASYILYFIIWFLSESNDFSTVISQDDEFISYLVIDCVNYGVFTLVLIILTFVLKQKVIGHIRTSHHHNKTKQMGKEPIKPDSIVRFTSPNGTNTLTNRQYTNST